MSDTETNLTSSTNISNDEADSGDGNDEQEAEKNDNNPPKRQVRTIVIFRNKWNTSECRA